jgi:hypothetical protein
VNHEAGKNRYFSAIEYYLIGLGDCLLLEIVYLRQQMKCFRAQKLTQIDTIAFSHPENGNFSFIDGTKWIL